MMNKQAAPLAATGGPDVSYLNLLNPLSPLMGGGDKYPEFMAGMFPKSPTAAWLTSKAGAIGLLAAGLFGGARLVQHVNRMADMRDKDDPADKLRSQLGTTFEVPLGKHASHDGIPTQSIALPDAASPKNIGYAAIPIGAALLAAAGGWRMADYAADNRRNKALAAAIQGKSNTIRDLMRVRARIAKGLATKPEVDKALASVSADDNYVKTATEKPAWTPRQNDPNKEHNLIRSGVTGLGLLLLAVGGATGLGAYKYFKAADPGNIQYDAVKKGLSEYARNKSHMTPITTIPTDASTYFQGVDEGARKPSPRDMPEPEHKLTPITVTV